jgi:predicted lipoprotein with Yx(FWY)xxD motif
MTTRKILAGRNGYGRKRSSNRPGHVRLLVTLPVAAVLAAAAVGSSAAAAPSPSPAVGSARTAAAVTMSNTTKLKTGQVGGVTVLTNAKGFTLYSFAPDTPTMSHCNGTCAQAWPPVKGPASAAGVKGKFATIRRSDGSIQATFSGHPLYTFTGDTAPGQAKGNGLNLNGGMWHEVKVAGAAKHSGGSSSGSGGMSGY